VAEFYYAVPLGNHPELIRTQHLLLQWVDQDGVRDIQKPDSFHITLCYVEDDQGADLVSVPLPKMNPFKVMAQRVNYFETPDGYAIHLEVEPSLPLQQIQRRVYRHAADGGAAVSAFGAADVWNPHVTMFYSDGKPAFGRLKTPLSLPVRQFVLSRGEYQVTDRYVLGGLNTMTELKASPYAMILNQLDNAARALNRARNAAYSNQGDRQVINSAVSKIESANNQVSRAARLLAQAKSMRDKRDSAKTSDTLGITAAKERALLRQSLEALAEIAGVPVPVQHTVTKVMDAVRWTHRNIHDGR